MRRSILGGVLLIRPGAAPSAAAAHIPIHLGAELTWTEILTAVSGGSGEELAGAGERPDASPNRIQRSTAWEKV